MNFQKISIQNFRSIKSLELDFPSSGIYLVSGENKQDETLGANGAGKSTFLDALHWCLLGETSRGLKGPSVESWNGVNAVDVSVVVDDIEYRRTRNPHKHYIQGQEVLGTENDFENLLIMFGQFGDSFLDMSPADKMSLFGFFLKLDHWLELSAKAKKEASDSEIEYDKIGLQIAIESSRKDEIENQIIQLRKKISECSSIPDLEKALKEAVKNLELAKKEVLKLEKKEKRLRAKRRDLNERNNEFFSDRMKSENNHSNSKAETRRLKKELATFVRLVEQKICPECGGELDATSGSLKIKKDGLEASIEEAEKKESKLFKILNSFEEESRKANQESEDMQAEAGQHSNAIVVARMNEESLQKEVQSANSNLDRMKSSVDTLMKAIEDLGESTVEINKKLTKSRRLQKDAELKMNLESFWIDGFKRIRLLAADNAATNLARLATAQLAELGLPEWELSFVMEKETASGTSSKKFHAIITNPRTEESIPWKAWSGGESQRCRIATDMAMATLVSTTSGNTSNIEFWDEPTRHLNPLGVEQLLQAFKTRAMREGKAIFVIDHRSAEFPFDGTLHITKSAEGVSSAMWK